MIEVKNLSKKFGDNLALDDISFEVKKGEILGFLGPNGAGKTTTMKILTSFWPADKGEVRIDNKDIKKDSLDTRKKIGYLPENVPLYEDMTVYEYLRFVAEVRGLKGEAVFEKVFQVVDSCGLAEVLHKLIEELSKGYRQRVGLAQAIVHDPEVLILDEPTTGLDPNQIVEIRDMIKRIGREKTIIFSTHILGEVSATCDRVVIINDGRIVGRGTPEDLAQTAGRSYKIYIKIKGYKEDVLKVLHQIPGIGKVSQVDQESERIYGYEIEPEGSEDIRERLSRTVFHKGWVIMELNRQNRSLEEVFRQLTQ